jgi:hypothetical protein
MAGFMRGLYGFGRGRPLAQTIRLGHYAVVSGTYRVPREGNSEAFGEVLDNIHILKQVLADIYRDTQLLAGIAASALRTN